MRKSYEFLYLRQRGQDRSVQNSACLEFRKVSAVYKHCLILQTLAIYKVFNSSNLWGNGYSPVLYVALKTSFEIAFNILVSYSKQSVDR